MKRVVLVGLGLIGGSIGLALRQNIPSLEIVGVDADAVVRSERCRELLTQAIPTESMARPDSVVGDADLVILAMPVCEIARQIKDWLADGIPVTDCGSTKAAIARAAASSIHQDWFLPGHPMAGRERGGLQSADPGLFRGRRWIVCPQSSTRQQVLHVVQTLARTLGAIWAEMTAIDHDRAVALTSHLPQIIASWLAANAGDSGSKAAGPAFGDMTRIAGGSEAMWRDIFVTNADAVAEVLAAASADFGAFATALRRPEPDIETLLALLERARVRS